MRECVAGSHSAPAMSAVRTGLHPAVAAGSLHGVLGGVVRCEVSLWMIHALFLPTGGAVP